MNVKELNVWTNFGFQSFKHSPVLLVKRIEGGQID